MGIQDQHYRGRVREPLQTGTMPLEGLTMSNDWDSSEILNLDTSGHEEKTSKRSENVPSKTLVKKTDTELTFGSRLPDHINCLIKVCTQEKDLLKIQCFINQCLGGIAGEITTQYRRPHFNTRFG